MKKYIIGIFLLLYSIISLNYSYASGPAPYSEPALTELNKSTYKIGSFIPPVGATKQETINALIIHYKNIYRQAGYDFEKSIVQFSNDIKKDPDFLSTGYYLNTPATIISVIIERINEIRNDGVSKGYLDKSMSTQTIKALDYILSIEQHKIAIKKDEEEKKEKDLLAEKEKLIKDNEVKRIAKIEEEKKRAKLEYEAKKLQLETDARIEAAEAEKNKEQNKQRKEIESLEKMNALKVLNGHYENRQGNKTYGSIDIKVMTENMALLNLYNNITAECKLNNQEVRIVYNQANNISLLIGDESEARINKNICSIVMKYYKASDQIKTKQGYSYAIEVERQENCKEYCKRGGTTMGRYIKIDQ